MILLLGRIIRIVELYYTTFREILQDINVIFSFFGVLNVR